MSSRPRTIPAGKALIPLDLVLKIYALLDATPSVSNLSRKRQPISARLTTFDHKKVTIDLNVCRPILRTQSREMSKIKEEKSMEDLMIIWLDQNVNQIKENVFKRKIDLREIINSLEMFDNVDQCLHLIKSIKEEKIFLIISGSLAKSLIKELNNSSQILLIYIYCSDERQHQYWVKNHSKIVGIFTDEYQLVTQITKDVLSYFRNDICINVINSIDTNERSIQDLTKDQAKFMWSQILIEILLRFPQTNQSKEDFIHECRRHYHNNTFQQKKIAEFEKNYCSSNALRWYTKDSFLYRIINKALRTQNILYIFKCRFFLIDLYQQLNKIHHKFIQTSHQKMVTVYRGQLMPTDEFNNLKNNIDGFISINTFFSTTHSSAVALQFAGDGSRRPLFQSVYFQIELHLDTNKVPFANVNTISQYQSENELILSIGTVFRIETVEPLNHSLWYVKLVSANQNETDKLNTLKDYLIEENDKVSFYLALGKVLQQMGEYDKAQTYYELLLAELPANHTDIPAIYAGLGAAILSMQKDSKVALKYLRQSIILQQKTFTNNILLFIQTLNAIAAIYVQRRKFKIALLLYQFIQEILESILTGPNPHQILKARAEIANNLGFIYSKIGRLSLALKYYQNSLTIERKVLPPNHPNIAMSLNNIGSIYLTKLDSETAERYFQEANTIRQQSLPFDYHPDLAQMYNNLGVVHYSKANFNKALFHFEKALEIQLKCLPPVHPDTASLYNSLGNTYLGKKEYQMALQMYQNSLKIGQQCWSSFHPQLGEVYQNIGTVYRCLGNYPKALENCEKALQIGLKCFPPTHSDLAEIYQEIGRVYSETDNHTMAVTNLHKAMEIYNKNPPINQKFVAVLYEEIGIEYYNQEQYYDSLKYLKKGFEMYTICKEEESSLTVLFYHLGKAYYQNAEYEDALLYYNKCLQFEISTTSKSNLQNLSQTYHAIGETFQTLTHYQMALNNYQKALEILLKDDSLSISSNQSSLTEKYQNDIQTVKALL